MRLGEFLNIKLGDIRMLDSHWSVSVFGKTGQRTIFFINSIPYLAAHLEFHPFKEEKNSYLWIGESYYHGRIPIEHQGFRKLIRNIFNRAGLKKQCNPHWFRHSRASLDAANYNEQMLCMKFGWTIGSEQVRRYCHLSARQLEDAFLKHHGLRKEDAQEEQHIRCICNTINTPDARYCRACGKALSVKIAIEDQGRIDHQIEERIRRLVEIMQNPEELARFEAFKADRKGTP